MIGWLWLIGYDWLVKSSKSFPDFSSNISLTINMGRDIVRNILLAAPPLHPTRKLRPKHRSTVGAEIFDIQIVPMMPLLEP